MTNRYGSELSTAIRLAREAGKLVLHYRDPDIQVDMKVGDEPVTVADRESSDLVMSGLQAEFGDDVIISEERADDLRRLSADRVWYIDPIDGTRDFISGREGFAVMIGLTVGHVPMVGVVYQPIGERLFWAEPDGAWFEVPGQEPRRLAVSATADMAEIRLVASRSHRSHKIDRVKSALGISTEFNIGSVGLKLALIALAERDLYVNPSPRCKSWDTCAPEAILRAAGGRMTDVHGEPLRYDVTDMGRPRGLVASNGAVHDAVIARMQPLFPPDTPPDR